jgi:hypothetical protein
VKCHSSFRWNPEVSPIFGFPRPLESQKVPDTKNAVIPLTLVPLSHHEVSLSKGEPVEERANGSTNSP